MDAQNESVEVDSGIEHSGISEYASCEFCGTWKEVSAECLCCIEDKEHHIQQESAERLRYLMSLGHPGESREPYNRWQTMDECKRRGKQLFLDLGWPVEPGSIYKNKYTGDEDTLDHELRNMVMQSDKDKPFEEMFSIQGWAVMEHCWPKEFWNDSQMCQEYKSKLSYFKDESSADEDMEDEVEDSDTEVSFHTMYDDIPKKQKKVVDKSQQGLGGWF